MSTTPAPPPPAFTLKIAFLGDANIGKSNLITTYTSNYYTGAYTETIEETYTKTVALADGTPIKLIIHDLGGNVDYDRLRLLFLMAQGTIDVFVLCFKLGDPASLDSIETRWKDIVEHVGKGVPIMVVGLKLDEWLGGFDGSEVGKRVGASAYRDCSALTKSGVEAVFEMTINIALAERREEERVVS